jgi:hypothetical protein
VFRSVPIVWLCIAGAGAFAEDLEVPAAARQFVLTADAFDEWVRGGTGDAGLAASRCAALLAHEIELLDRACSLSDAQKRKLLLAGRGDIKNFLDRAGDLRSKYVGTLITPDQYQAIRSEIDRLRTTNRWDLFHDHSLYKKTMRKLLTDEQVDRLTEWVIAEWDLRVRDIHLEDDSRRQLAKLLRAKSNPPLGWSYYTYHVVTLQLAALEDEVRPLVVDKEWPAFAQQFAEAKRLEPKLRELGAWPVRPPSDMEE